MLCRRLAGLMLWAASAALALAGCADHPTAPTGPLAPAGTPLADLSAVKFWEAGSSVAWNKIARDFTQARIPFNNAFEVRALTYVSVAQYNAIIAAENAKTPGTQPAPAGAAAGASVMVLKEFFPSQAGFLEQKIAEQAAQRADAAWPGEQREDFAAGVAIGRAVGAAVVDYARGDHFNVGPAPTALTGPGHWTGTAPSLGLFGTRPWMLESPGQFRSDDPPPFGSPEFLADLAEVRRISDTRTTEQRDHAVLWDRQVGAYLNGVASDLIVSHRRNERDAAHILALANMAAFDASIGCWDSKFTYWYIRPVQADPMITLVIPMPNHPSYPSGHACSSSAYSTVLAQAFPDARPQIAADLEAAGLSRIYAGIHYRFDIEAGRLLGRQVAEHVLSVDATGHEPIPLD